jgi:4-hydroxy-4-methyl-2-oxoglutarate aldolase
MTRYTGHVPVVRPRIGRAAAPPDPAVLDLLAEVPVDDVSDAVGRLYTMSPRIAPLYAPIRRAVGAALTVKAHPGDNLAIHGALGMVRPHEMLVVDWLGYADGCGSGARSLAAPVAKGLAGIVIDGGWRDVDELQAQGFPVFGRHAAAFSPAKREPGEINVPVCCGGVVVEPGDVVVADASGVAVIPRRCLDDVVAALTADRRSAPGARVQPAAHEPVRAGMLFDEVFEARDGVRD